MLWKLNSAGEPVVVTSKLMQSSSCGWLKVFEIAGQTVIETDDMLIMGLMNEKFIKREMPKLRKSLGISNEADKQSVMHSVASKTPRKNKADEPKPEEAKKPKLRKSIETPEDAWHEEELLKGNDHSWLKPGEQCEFCDYKKKKNKE